MPRYIKKYIKNSLIHEVDLYVNTVGEIEAAISTFSAINEIKLINIFLPKINKSNLDLRNSIDLFEKLSHIKINTHFQSFKISFLQIVFLKKDQSKILVSSMNFFDIRHNYIYRIIMHFFIDFVIRDSIVPHKISPADTENFFLPPILLEKEAYNDSYSGLLIKILNKSNYLILLKNYLSSRLSQNPKVLKKVLIISKNVPSDYVPSKNLYVKLIVNIFNNKDVNIYIKPHPRELSADFGYVKEYDLRINEKNTMYEQIFEADLVIVFGGSTGWLTKYTKKLIYIDDKIFNRGNYKNARYKGENVVRNINELEEVLLKKIN